MIINKILDAFENLLKYVCTIFMGGIVVILFYAVLMRYILHRPPAWSMELSRYMFLWMIMLCAVLVTRERSHIRMNFLLSLLPVKIRFAWVNLMRLMMIGFCLIMVVYGWRIFPIVAEASSPTLNISMGYMYISIPVGGFLMALFFFEILIRSFINREWTLSQEEEN